jgi:hypothetical protein
VEKYLSSSAVQISAAAFLAILVGVFVGHVAQRNTVTEEGVVAIDARPLPGMSDEDLKRLAHASQPGGPVSSTLPTEPDADYAAASGGRYANVVPDKAPSSGSTVVPAPGQKPGFTVKPAPSQKSAPVPKQQPYAGTDQTTMHVRRLQTQLMVGALSCGQQRMVADYNSFVTKFDRALKANGVALKSYFAKTFGSRGANEMDAFITKLSNELSLVSMRNPSFCERTGGLFDSVLALAPGEIESFADRYLNQPMVARDGF